MSGSEQNVQLSIQLRGMLAGTASLGAGPGGWMDRTRILRFQCCGGGKLRQ